MGVVAIFKFPTQLGMGIWLDEVSTQCGLFLARPVGGRALFLGSIRKAAP